MAGEDEAGDGAAEETAEAFFAFGGGEALEIAEFSAAEDLDAFRSEVVVEAGKGEAGAVDGGFADEAVEALGAGDEFEAEGGGVGLEEAADAGRLDFLGGGHGYMVKVSPR